MTSTSRLGLYLEKRQRFWRWRFWRYPLLAAAAVLAAALLGVVVVQWTTEKWGPGANSDGLSYLILARSLIAGEGYGYPRPGGGLKPITHFPPGYPLAIAGVARLTHSTPETAAAMVNAAAVLLLVTLSGWAAYRATRHVVPVAALAGWLVLAYATQRIYTEVFSETLFLALLMAVGWGSVRWQARPVYRRAVLVGLLAAATVYVRWVGMMVPLWAAADTVLAWRGRWPRRGWRQIAAMLAAAAAPVALLLLANRWRAGSGTNRHILWHPPGLAKWQQAAEAIAGWLFPGAPWAEAYAWGIAVAFVAVEGALVWAAWRAAQRTPSPSEDATAFRDTTRRWGGFALLYWGALVAAITLVDASTPMDWRLLVILFPTASLLFFTAAWRLAERRFGWATALVIAWGLALFFTGRYTHDTLLEDRYMGAVLRTRIWQQAEIWGVLRKFPSDALLVTNSLEETIYYTGRPARLLMEPYEQDGRLWLYDPVTLESTPLPTPSLDAWAEALAARLHGQCAGVVMVSLKWRYVSPDKRTAEQQAVKALSRALRVVYQGEDGWVFAPSEARCLPPREH